MDPRTVPRLVIESKFLLFFKFKTPFTYRGYNICARFPDYKVAFYGIGPGPKGSEELGACSQMALFIREDFLKLTSKDSDDSESCHNNQLHKPQTTAIDFKKLNTEKVCSAKSSNVQGGEQLSEGDVLETMIVDLTTTHINAEDYRLIRSCVYPRNMDDRSREQKIFDEACFHLGRYMNLDDEHYDADTDTIKVPVKNIFKLVYKYTSDINEFR